LTRLLETIASLQAFRKRHADAQRLNAQFANQPTTVDFSHYRTILKNKAIVDEAEKLLKEFKPVSYDVNAQIKAIEAFEAKAVSFWCTMTGPIGWARRLDDD
jgi:F-type H+-transporting ATPase subunit d